MGMERNCVWKVSLTFPQKKKKSPPPAPMIIMKFDIYIYIYICEYIFIKYVINYLEKKHFKRQIIMIVKLLCNKVWNLLA